MRNFGHLEVFYVDFEKPPPRGVGYRKIRKISENWWNRWISNFWKKLEKVQIECFRSIYGFLGCVLLQSPKSRKSVTPWTKRTLRISEISSFQILTSRWVEHDQQKHHFRNLQNHAIIFRMLVVASTLLYENLFLFEKYLTKVPTGSPYFTRDIIYISLW